MTKLPKPELTAAKSGKNKKQSKNSKITALRIYLLILHQCLTNADAKFMLFLQLIDLLLPSFLFFHIWKFRHPPKVFLTSHTYVLLLPGLRQWTVIPICWKRTAFFPPGWGKKHKNEDKSWHFKQLLLITLPLFKLHFSWTSTTHLAQTICACKLRIDVILSIQHYSEQRENNSHHCQKRIAKDVSGPCL